MALDFPASPAIGDLYPANPGTSGVTQYRYAGNFRWDVVTPLVSLGTANQGAYNQYKWPATAGAPNEQLTTNGSGTLSWEVPSNPSLQIVNLLEPFDGTRQSFTLVKFGTPTPFIPNPSTNLVVFLGGVPQIPTAAYSVPLGTSTINFTEAPLSGATFYAISNINA
jgi:hypothetical protein